MLENIALDICTREASHICNPFPNRNEFCLCLSVEFSSAVQGRVQAEYTSPVLLLGYFVNKHDRMDGAPQAIHEIWQGTSWPCGSLSSWSLPLGSKAEEPFCARWFPGTPTQFSGFVDGGLQPLAKYLCTMPFKQSSVFDMERNFLPQVGCRAVFKRDKQSRPSPLGKFRTQFSNYCCNRRQDP